MLLNVPVERLQSNNDISHHQLGASEALGMCLSVLIIITAIDTHFGVGTQIYSFLNV